MKTPEENGTIIEFLLGEKPFDGVWFGDKHPTFVGRYWWRKLLREYASQPSIQEGEQATAIGLLQGFINAHEVLDYNINQDLIERTKKYLSQHPSPIQESEGKVCGVNCGCTSPEQCKFPIQPSRQWTDEEIEKMIKNCRAKTMRQEAWLFSISELTEQFKYAENNQNKKP